MMIVMRATATEQEVQAVIDRVRERRRARAHPIYGEELTVIGAIGDRSTRAGSTSRARPASTGWCRS